MADFADLIITNHAIERYIERIRQVTPEQAKREILMGLRGAKEKHLRKIKPKKRTVIVPTCYGFFVFDGLKLVTCLKEKREEDVSRLRMGSPT